MKNNFMNRMIVKFNNRKLKNMYRYTVRMGNHGGIVIAKNEADARHKVFNRYSKYGYRQNEVLVWPIIIDDYYVYDHRDVIDCYGD